MTGFFQSERFLTFISEGSSFEPFRFSVLRSGQEVARIQGFIQRDGGPIKRFLSRRAIVNSGPFLAEDITPTELKELLRKCSEGLRRKAIYIETRNFRDYTKYRKIFEECGFQYESHYDFIVNTESFEIAEGNLGKSRKRDIRTSLRDGAKVIDNPTEEQVKAFYSVLEDLYKTKIKTPLFPLEFFVNLFHNGFSKFILVKYQEEIIGGTVCVFDDDTVYEWFACGRDGVYKNIFPSTLATWSGIKFAAESGRKCFDMMGAGAPRDGGYGVRDFKAKFGGELVEYGRFRYVCNKPLYSLGKAAVRIMKG